MREDMMNNKKKKRSDNQSYINNWYAVTILAKTCKKRLIFIIINAIMTYFEWLFAEVFFIKKLVEYIENKEPFDKIVFYLVILSVIFMVISLLKAYYTYYIVPQTNIVVDKKMYTILYKKARNVELACYENPSFYSKYTMALDGAANRIVESVNTTVNIVVGIIATIFAMAIIISMSIPSCIFIIFPIVGNFVIGKYVNKIYNDRYVNTVEQERVIQYVNRVMYLQNYAKEMRFSNVYKVLIKKFRKVVIEKTQVMRNYGKSGTFYMSVKNILTFPLPFEGLMMFAAYQTIVLETMKMSSLAVIYSTMAATSWILIGVFNSMVEYMKNGIKIGYIKEFLAYKESIPEDYAGKPVNNTIESIEFKDVCFNYKDKEIIHNLSFKITSNQCIAIVGCNGAGKSTIIKLLLRLYDPVSGSILVNGVNIIEYSLRDYRRLFSVAFQDYRIMGMSIRENVTMGEIINDEIVNDVIKEVGLHIKLESMGQNLDTIMTKEFDSEGILLSGGEQQKLMLARAFAKKAPICIFDEPSSALDPIAENEIFDCIVNKNKKVSNISILISHRLSTVRRADNILLLSNGSLCGQGKHDDLIRSCEMYKELYYAQAKKYLAVE